MWWSSVLTVACCSYWLTGLEGNFFAMVATTAFFGFVGASTSLLLSSLASTVQVAMQLMPLAFVPQLLFAGFFIPISNIPVFLRWAQYLCSLKYALNLMMLLEVRRWWSACVCACVWVCVGGFGFGFGWGQPVLCACLEWPSPHTRCCCAQFDQKPDSWPSQYDAQFANYQNAVCT